MSLLFIVTDDQILKNFPQNKDTGILTININLLTEIFFSQHQKYLEQNPVSILYLHTLISLINVGPTLTDFEKFHPPQNKNPPSTFIDFLDFSTLHSSFIRVMY